MARKSGGSAAELSEAAELDMTPMIDVTFLLIVFFLCVTELADMAKEKLTLPRAERSVEDAHEPGRLIININQEGEVYINKNRMDPSQLRRQLKLEKQRSWNEEEGLPSRAILVRVDKNTRFVHVYSTMKMCMEEKLWKLAFAVKFR
jgi:biopolymer transport protein ExbD